MAAKGASQKQNVGAPNKTLYVTNIPSSKIRKDDLRRALYTLFSTYGPVLDVVALLTMKMRGQAHIAFRDLGAATQALRSLQGFDFFGHELKIAYAKSESHIYGKLEGKATASKPGQLETVEGVTDVQREVFGGGAKPVTEEKGVKRPREESDNEGESEGEAEMEVDDDGDAPMEEDSSDED